jgi:hypothetical protein
MSAHPLPVPPPPALLLLLLLALCAPACDREDPAAQGMPLETAGRRLLHLRTITQLLPNRPTHIAVDRLAHVYWVQESEDGQDVLFRIGEGGIPRTTRLTTANILTALDESGDTTGAAAGAGAGGNIRDVAAAEGGIFFYFYGYRGSATKACVGQYYPQSGRIRVVANTAALEKASGMGRSMQLARASLVASGQTLYLWLRHTDASAFLSFDPRAVGADGKTELRVAFAHVVSEERKLPLTRIDADISAAPGGALYLLDLTGALLWHVDRTGEATAVLPLIGLPKRLSPPTVAGDDRLLLFAADSERIGTELEIATRQDLPAIDYPALLEIEKTEIRAIGRDDFRAHAGFPAYAVKLGRLVPESPGSYIAYDETSGALMRVKVSERE